MEYVKSGILNEEARRRSQDTSTSTSQSDILVTDYRGKNPTARDNQNHRPDTVHKYEIIWYD